MVEGWVGGSIFELNCIRFAIYLRLQLQGLFLSAFTWRFVTTTNHIPFGAPHTVENASVHAPLTNIPAYLPVNCNKTMQTVIPH